MLIENVLKWAVKVSEEWDSTPVGEVTEDLEEVMFKLRIAVEEYKRGLFG